MEIQGIRAERRVLQAWIIVSRKTGVCLVLSVPAVGPL